jgi:hypothetical protein
LIKCLKMLIFQAFFLYENKKVTYKGCFGPF